MDYHSHAVAGYFANHSAVDAAFFEKGDSFACQYSCAYHKSCKTMPDAKAWHEGAL